MSVKILVGDVRKMLGTMADASVNCIVTSPPYFGLRDYGMSGQIGLETTPADFVAVMVDVFRETRRLLRNDGTFWLNLGDSYSGSGKGGNPPDSPHQKQATNKGSVSVVGNTAREAARTRGCGDDRLFGLKSKNLIGIPWRVAFALQDDGWYLRDAIIWAKPNGMPGSQVDRCTSSYEMIFQFSKSESYWSDFDAIKTPPRESTLIRTAQDVQAQAGSHRANGGAKTNGPMKAIGGPPKQDKQRGHGRKHAGFDARWDAMEREQQMAEPAMMRNVWFVSPATYDGAHFAVMPEEIARRCILAGCPKGGTVLDPFGGAGTTCLVADRFHRDGIMIDLNPEYAELARSRIRADAGMFSDVA